MRHFSVVIPPLLPLPFRERAGVRVTHIINAGTRARTLTLTLSLKGRGNEKGAL
jgi:hypothetical protein